MKRPRSWLRIVLFIGLLLVLAEYAALTWLAPYVVMRAVGRIAGGELVIGKARLAPPLTTKLSGVRSIFNTEQAALSIQQVIVRSRWLSVPKKTLWVDTVEIHRPLLRLTRTAAGTMLWPRIPERVSPGSARVETEPTARGRSKPLSWQILIDSVKVVDGAVEFLDEKASGGFHGSLDHVSIEMGPVTIPLSGPQMSFAIRALVNGESGRAAPAYCSGWVDFTTKDLQASCHLEPIELAAFDPYYHGKAEVRVYTSTVSSTSQWGARSNDFQGRIQLELGQLSEGDLSIHGRTVVDVKRLMTGQDPTLKGEVTITGLLDRPAEWRMELVPGDDAIQQLVKRLLNHGVQVVRLPLIWGGVAHINLAPASKAAMTDIEATSKEVQEALEILSGPSAEELAKPLTEPEVTTQGEPAAESGPPAPPNTAPTPTEDSAPPVTPTTAQPSVPSPAPTP